ncbi:MAG: tRNA uridine-5-carboxymethylaminomethyl(34) synthesis GTPase MnmE [Rickettsiaceae bacterium]|nr:tRNA uridine-5-carboxymethylaminomethyl(34) synthesis GTPase MnmE [Rickettsiaceae bacterium]MDP4832417.1 tRNA uridine-5-carboxymethylaminomethyl(34) synthesis GTPase MnmE [Rickettsiaceae bacterium]MDP5020146.1 tRNA uridine-5-carboxymethylaminomethyl(34) synthesis GTPase MnmE [Rickettsiaceae bacterium]MDP5082756.1 tRNA uridine-5-carboxymethylaminomethyl(34) synthesis GTPase MnmE [Rickettsiaceae bacterium]
MDTIFAQCSAHGKAGVAVFRISGPNTITILGQLIRGQAEQLEPRKLYFRNIFNPHNQQQIDESMVVFFSKNSSFTGEDSAEIHTHGSLAVIKLLNETLTKLPEIRLAEAGEFAKRAFLNGKIDLTAAEGLADLIDSETELQHRQAIKQLGGGLEKIYEQWRMQLLKLISLLEAYIDFPDEDIPEETLQQVGKLIEKIAEEIKEHLNDNNRGERLRSGLKLTILGKPNVGKSSLLNYLMHRELAIVSNIAGTTRDIIEGHLDIGGYPIIIQDTAGIHQDTTDIIEQEGMERAKKASLNSDIKIIIYDASTPLDNNDYFTEIIDDNTIILLNKIDLCEKTLPKEIQGKTPLSISLKKQDGLKELLNQIIIISERIARPSEAPQITRARHRAQLEQALEYLSTFSLDNDLVLITEDIRMTIRAISNITGKITVDEILGEIFSNFCIGK